MIALHLDVHVTQGAFDLSVHDEALVEVVGLFGASGSGKTTLLEAIAGLRRPARGEIRVGTRVLYSSATGIDVPVRRRGIGYVPQEGALFPHLSVRGNLTFGARHAARLPDIAAMLEIEGLLDRRVPGLSGGERQRVAIGRALMAEPALLLLDEPLAGVDRPRRERILPYLLRIRRELHVPLVYVTHDRDELTQVADRVLVIDAGRLAAAGPPADVLAA
ncbi:MAG: ATP-binding cassette domain-containing protein [Acidobacteriota bacterium]